MDLFDFTENMTGKSRLDPEFFHWLNVGAEGVTTINLMQKGYWEGLFENEEWAALDKRYFKIAFLLGRNRTTFENLQLMTDAKEEDLLYMLEIIGSF
jgi:hypothetical protein